MEGPKARFGKKATLRISQGLSPMDDGVSHGPPAISADGRVVSLLQFSWTENVLVARTDSKDSIFLTIIRPRLAKELALIFAMIS